MDDTPRARRRLLPLLIGGLAVMGVGLVLAGRLLDGARFSGWQDPFYSVLLAFTVDGTFLSGQNAVTVLGAFAAAAATYLGLGAAVAVFFGSRIAAWRARHARHHIVVVGDDSDAEAMARHLAAHHKVVLVSPVETARGGDFLAIEPAGSTAELVVAAHLSAAKAIVVMRDDEQHNAALATSLAVTRAPGSDTAIWCRVGDRLLAERVASPAFGEPRILVFDDASASARQAFAQHPAHATAERLAAPAVHIAIFGFGRLGQAMAEEALFSGIARGLGRPRVTVLDVDPDAEIAYRASRPALDLAGDFAFITADLVAAATAPALAQAALDGLAARDEAGQVTALALCLHNDEDNVRLALSLTALAQREGRYLAPIFMRVRDRDACALVLGTAPAVIALERPTLLLAADIVDLAQRDQAARLLHEAGYRKSGGSPGASADWNRLPETYRRANRRGGDHIAAKLWSIGLTSERDPHKPITVETATFAAAIAPLADGSASAELDRLAGIEHRRWMAERALEGWVAGSPRDDDRRVHPMLAIPEHADLPAAERQKDADQVVTLMRSVAPSDLSAAARREICVGLAGHRNLDPAEERRAVAELVAQLLHILPEHAAVTLVSPLAPGADLAATEALVAALAKRPGLRLIALEAVPYRVVLEVAAGESGRGADAVTELLGRRAALFRRVPRAEIAAIRRTGQSDDSYRRDRAVFERGLARANAYLARHCDIVGLLWDGAMARGAGGTGELAAYCRDPANIPPDIDPGASPRRPERPQLIVVPVGRG